MKPYAVTYRTYIKAKYGFYRFLYLLKGRPFPVKEKKRWREISYDVPCSPDPEAVVVGKLYSGENPFFPSSGKVVFNPKDYGVIVVERYNND